MSLLMSARCASTVRAAINPAWDAGPGLNMLDATKDTSNRLDLDV